MADSRPVGCADQLSVKWKAHPWARKILPNRQSGRVQVVIAVKPLLVDGVVHARLSHRYKPILVGDWIGGSGMEDLDDRVDLAVGASPLEQGMGEQIRAVQGLRNDVFHGGGLSG